MKFIASNFWDTTGQSYVTLKHLGSFFTGKAKLHPDDKEYASELTGCSYAESRAIIKALKYERELAKQEAETCRKFIKACECYKGWNKEDPSAKVAYRQLNRKIKKVNDITDEINKEMLALQRAMTQRIIIQKRFESKEDNQDK